jgi:hypothetical protein
VGSLTWNEVFPREFSTWLLRARVDQERFPVAMEGGTPGHLLWLYLDARDTLGHYLEYCWMTPERWTMIRGL